ncbi:MAG: small multi-drug export protein, partial [Dehalococcoidia bacterium]|nr:small multi-drug export protein [Dehalococcoidia bacterium]
HGAIGLVLFVAIPLPVTGAWTGSIVAFLLGLSFWRAFPAIFLGVVIAGVIVTTLTVIGWWGAAIAGIGLLALAILSLRKVW